MKVVEQDVLLHDTQPQYSVQEPSNLHKRYTGVSAGMEGFVGWRWSRGGVGGRGSRGGGHMLLKRPFNQSETHLLSAHKAPLRYEKRHGPHRNDY